MKGFYRTKIIAYLKESRDSVSYYVVKQRLDKGVPIDTLRLSIMTDSFRHDFVLSAILNYPEKKTSLKTRVLNLPESRIEEYLYHAH